MAGKIRDWHIPRPSVYLDQWVWIRFARVVRGVPKSPDDERVLAAVREAAAAGVVFPLSATHYVETLRINDPRQRADLVEVMAPISQLQTIRSQGDLVRHQIKVALHETVGRPMFAPTPPAVLGLGVSWAFRGVESQVSVLGPDERPVAVNPRWLRHVMQYTEASVLGGPSDEEIPDLVKNGYRSVRDIDAAPLNRLEWEELFATRLAEQPKPSAGELRRWVLGRELIHEYKEIFAETMNEYGLTLEHIAASAPATGPYDNAVSFAERIPTMRIAADLKILLFQNPARSWSHNMVRDIDALSLAIPYCHAVVADKDAAAFVRRARVDSQYGTTVLSDLSTLPEVLEGLRSRLTDGDAFVDAWDRLGPGNGFAMTPPEPLFDQVPPGATVHFEPE